MLKNPALFVCGCCGVVWCGVAVQEDERQPLVAARLGPGFTSNGAGGRPSGGGGGPSEIHPAGPGDLPLPLSSGASASAGAGHHHDGGEGLPLTSSGLAAAGRGRTGRGEGGRRSYYAAVRRW